MLVPVPAPFACVVLQHCVSVGQLVAEGQDVVSVEACKLECPVASPVAGVVARLAAAGSSVEEGEAVAEIERLSGIIRA